MKNYLLALILIFCLSFTLAAPTITLNSPADGSTQYLTTITTNATVGISGGATIVNRTLYNNKSGTWLANNSYAFTTGIVFNISGVSGGSAGVTTTAYTSPNNHTLIKNVSTDWSCETNCNSLRIVNTYYYEDGTSANEQTDKACAGTGTHVFVNPLNGSIVNYTTMTLRCQDAGLGYVTSTANGYQPTNLTMIDTLTGYTAGQTYKWNYRACASDGSCSFATSNRTFYIDSSGPSISINYPTTVVAYGGVGLNMQLNFTATDTNLDKCWYSYNSVNTTVSCSTGVAVLSNFSLTSSKTVIVYANDTIGNIGSSSRTWSYKITENNRSFNTTSYETAYETYSINVTANSSLTSVTLEYDGDSFAMVNTATNVWSYSRDLPSSAVGNNSFRFVFVYAGNTYYSDYSYQNVLPLTLTLCNATYTTPFINFTFKDENTLASINGTLQSAYWTYYLGTGTESKTYTYSTSTSNPSYAFCASPTNRVLYASPELTYLDTSYPARFYTPPEVLNLSNATTNTTLYLLNSADGIYVTFATVSQISMPISGASIIVKRDIAGVNVTLGSGTTDAAGSYTIWLNPNYDHIVSASKTGYASNTQTIRPTQSSYTLILSASSNYSYLSNVQGLLWAYFPRTGLTAVPTNFGFNVSSASGNLIKCKIELLNPNKSIIISQAETTTANGSFCSVQTTYTPNATYPQMKGRLLVDVGEGYKILEEDAFWVFLAYNSTGLTLTDWFHSINSSSMDLRYFNDNDQHREFTYILIFFLVLMIIVAVLNVAGWDIQTRGGMIILIDLIIIVASVPGFLSLAGISISLSPFIDQYFVAIVFTMYTIGYMSRSLT